MSTPKFTSSKISIYNELKENVYSYLNSQNVAPTGNARLYFKAAFLLTGYLSAYVILVFFTPPAAVALLICALLGFFTAGIGFNVMHDGGHGSFSSSKKVNKLAAMTVDFLGASSFMWHSKHNIVHHTYTNIDGIDDDIEAEPFLRFAPTQKYHPLHKFQHIYFWFFYSLLYLAWVYYTDYKKYFSGKVGIVAIQKMKTSDHINFWAFKFLNFIMMVVVPIWVLGFGTWAIGYTVFALSTGLIITIVFQLAHTVGEAAFPEAVQPANKIEDEWAIHQLKTTANFSAGNKFITWYVGGLNYQIEHHLFPKVSHVHYPEISRIIQDVCAKAGVPYIQHMKMTDAIASHIAHLKELGKSRYKAEPALAKAAA